MRKSWFRHRRFWLLALCCILLALLGSTLPLENWFTGLKDWLKMLGPWAMPGFSLLYLLATILGLPSILLILTGGTLFGLAQGIIAASIADTLGAIFCFVIGRTIARKRIKNWIRKNPNFARLDQAVGQKGWKILLLTRLSPLVPSNVLNYGFSCTKVNFWQYSFFSWLGMLPTISLYTYMGSLGFNLFHQSLTSDKLAFQAFGLFLAIAAAFYATRVTQKALTLECKDS